MTQQPKPPIKGSNIIDIKLVATELSKTDQKLSKTIKQTKTVSEVVDAGKNPASPLYGEIRKREIF